jgi:F-type H+-transporting ATPase subunit b
MLDLDVSLLVVFALVAVLLFTLNRIFFRPVGKAIADRETLIRRTEEEYKARLREVETKTSALEARLKEARSEGLKLQQDLIRQSEDLRLKLVSTAHEQASAQYAEAMAKLDREIETATRELDQRIGEFAAALKKALP